MKCWKVFAVIALLAISLPGFSMRASLSYCTFWSPDGGSFIETYLAIHASSMKYIPAENGQYQATAEIMMVFKSQDSIVTFRKYELKSPLIKDTNERNFHFIDQQRFLLDDGEYIFEIALRDLNTNSEAITHQQAVQIQHGASAISLSGLQLVETATRTTQQGPLTKAGYDLVPNLFNFFKEDQNKLTYYAELYHTESILGKDQRFLLSTYIQGNETGEIIKDLIRNRRETARDVIPLLQEFDISRLPSGNYNLVIEVRSSQNELLASNSLFFYRINPNVQLELKDIAALDISNTFVDKINHPDTLIDYIRSLQPIASEMERIFADKNIATGNQMLMKQFFLNFWLERDAFDPEKAWNAYHDKVKLVNQKFSTRIKRGYETDRGIVFLRYGPPNTIAESYFEPSAYPYEIWHYYELRNQRNKKFVFYSRDRITNDFDLIHSDATGEIANYRWKLDVLKRTTDGYDLDQQDVDAHWGGRIDTYFRDPR